MVLPWAVNGALVVCLGLPTREIAKSFSLGIKIPEKGKVYTIHHVESHPMNKNRIGLALDELDHRWLFEARLFKPVDKNDIKMFQTMMEPTKIDA